MLVSLGLDDRRRGQLWTPQYGRHSGTSGELSGSLRLLGGRSPSMPECR